MKRRNVRNVLMLGALAALTLAGSAVAQMAKSPDEIVAERQRFMKLNGASWKDVQDKLKAGLPVEMIAVNAETMAQNGLRITSYFPPGSMTDKSKAKPEIWQKWSDFEAAAKTMTAESEKLREAAMAKNADAVQAIAKDFGRNACGTCHQPFRVPPPQQQQPQPQPPQR
jgi:cytochrome c556